MLRVSVAALVCAGVVAVPRAQQPATFSAGNRTVAVFATVTDAAGRLVPDLGRDRERRRRGARSAEGYAAEAGGRALREITKVSGT